jgi:uracil-DNA glycosylase family 4
MNSLEILRDECLSCRKCEVGGVMVEDTHLSNVFSNMNGDARVMVVGQNPGIKEVEMGEPFVGPSGAFFDRSVEEIIGLHRSDFYVSNAVRCYTPGNRPPRQGEKDNCRYFLDREIAIVNPEVIIALGAPAFKQLTGLSGIMKHCGEKVFSPRYGVFVIPIIHPSPRNTNDPGRREIFYEGLRRLKEVLDEDEAGGSAEV